LPCLIFPDDNYATSAVVREYKVFPLGESQAFRESELSIKGLDTESIDYRYDRKLIFH